MARLGPLISIRPRLQSGGAVRRAFHHATPAEGARPSGRDSIEAHSGARQGGPSRRGVPVRPRLLAARRGGCSTSRALHGDDDFGSRVSLSEIPDRLGNLTQRIGSVNDRRDLSGFNEMLEGNKILFAVLRDVNDDFLPHEARQHLGREKWENRLFLTASTIRPLK